MRSFNNLGKCAEEFEDQQLQVGEQEPAGKGFSFGALRRLFNFSGERFEALTLRFSSLVKNAESGLGDVVEVIGAVDSFARDRDESVRKLWAEQGGEPEDSEGMNDFYVSILGSFVESVQRFLEQSQEGFVRVLEESSGQFGTRIRELIDRSEQNRDI